MIHVFRPIPVGQLKLLVFDLDGTLIDSAQDLCNSVNATLTESGFNTLPDAAIAGFVGNGAPMLMRRSVALASGVAPGEVDEEKLAKARGKGAAAMVHDPVAFIDTYIRFPPGRDLA